jgi:putative NIF3 family GTP cyclohydrolase 1 type 2
MYTATEIATIFETIAPRSLGIPYDELGIIFGEPQTPIRGIACLWKRIDRV